MKHSLILRNLCMALMLIAAAIGCKKNNEDILAKPVVKILEVGSGDSKKAYAGYDLHLEAEIEANAIIEKVELVIRSSAAGSWQYQEVFTTGYAGARNAVLHEHIDIPLTAALGNYQLYIRVTDKAGQLTEAQSLLTILKKNPSASLLFTKLSGTGLEAHGDHFHGLGTAVEGATVTVSFDETGAAITNGHLHLEATGIYKVALKTFDESGAETQNKFIANAATAANYKAFLPGGNFILNPNTAAETGAIFQTRETSYADGSTVTGGATVTTGVLSYFIAGNDNKGAKDVVFVMRKVNTGVKPTITRLDWNRNDYATAFGGSNELQLKFEIHAE